MNSETSNSKTMHSDSFKPMYIDRSLTEESLEIGRISETLFEHLDHWRCHVDNQQVQWWLLDQQHSKTNTLSQAVLKELQELVDSIDGKTESGKSVNSQPRPKAVVIRSVKSSGFIAGADISEFRGVDNPAQVEALIAEGNSLFNQLEALPIPTIALLHGFCLGGGLELALACRYRIARFDTQLGFPEVKLGLHPGLGGTVRLTRQIDPTQALPMMLTGKSIPAKRAKKLGLVDSLGEERHFAEVVKQIIAGNLPRRGQSRKTKWMSNKLASRVISYFAQKQARAAANEAHYPAPFALIELWRQHSNDAKAMLAAEQHSFSRLLCSQTAQNLVRVFFLQESLKAQGKLDHGIRHVHVIGAGTMGGDIAAWCASKGFKVTVEDREAKYIAPAIKRAHALFSRKLHSNQQRRDAADRLIPDLAGFGRSSADLIIEATPEILALKSDLLQGIEAITKPGAIIATNTSSILLEKMRGHLQDPSRFVGIHFFNPVAQMQLVEIVSHDQLDSSVKERAQAFTTAIGRLPMAVTSAPGFLVNRVLTPYLLEALALIDEGYSKEDVDQAGIDFGMPMGPVELADFIGLDICLHVAETLHQDLEQAMYPVPDWLREKVDNNELGKKTGKGLYQYDSKGKRDKKGKQAKHRSSGNPDKQLQDRLILPLLNTCVMCLEEGVVSDSQLLDGALIFATGFAPFSGGPLHYAKTRGVDDIVGTLNQFAEKYGDRFKPSPYWQSI